MSDNSEMEKQMVIREILPGVTTLSVPFTRSGIIKFGGRATIIQMPNGLAIFNPVSLTPKVRTLLTKLSLPVTYIIAPDIEHHMHLSTWSTAFPSAKIIAPEGLPEKRASMNGVNKAVTIVDFHKIVTRKEKDASPDRRVSTDGEFDREFDLEYVDAHINKELVFLHKKSRTLIQADLFFNMPATEQYSKSSESATGGILSGLFARVATTQGTAIWQKRMLWYLMSAKDREGWNASAKRIAKWDFVNVVPAHGDCILGEGKSVFEKLFGWHLAA